MIAEPIPPSEVETWRRQETAAEAFAILAELEANPAGLPLPLVERIQRCLARHEGRQKYEWET